MSEFITAARPYAKAAFESAEEGKSLEQWSEQLGFMASVAADPDFRMILDNPRLTSEEAADLFLKVCEDDINDQGTNLVRLLAENGRLVLLPEISLLFEKHRAEAQGSIDAEIVSAYRVSKEQKATIETSLKKRLGREVNLTSRIDKSLLGGAVIRAGDLVIDGSLKARLEKMNAALTR